MSHKNKASGVTTGIIDEGEDSFYGDVSTEGFDVGFHNKGKRTKVVGGKHVSNKLNEIEIIVDGKIYRLNNNSNKYNLAKKDAGLNANTKQILAHYDKKGGYIQDKNGDKIEDGKFWDIEKVRIAEEPKQLKHKTDEELQDIMRESIDNSYVPSSIYHKAKQELEFRGNNKNNGNNGIVAGGNISAGGDIILGKNKATNKVSKKSLKDKWFTWTVKKILTAIISLVVIGLVSWFGWK